MKVANLVIVLNSWDLITERSNKMCFFFFFGPLCIVITFS